MKIDQKKTRKYLPYDFSSLPKYTREEVEVLKRSYRYVPEEERIRDLLAVVSQAFLSFDIYNTVEAPISLLVKPTGEIGKAQLFRFTQPGILMGRTPDNQVVLKSPLVSKKHAEIFRRGVEFYLRDLKSNNGTFLNDVKLNSGGEVILKNEDVIKIDPFQIVVNIPPNLSKQPLEIQFRQVNPARYRNWPGQLACFFQVHPSLETGALLLDREVARWMLQKIVTGQQKQSGIVPWTEIETGLLEYITAKILSVINPKLSSNRLILQSIEGEREFSQWFQEKKPMLEMTFEAQTEVGPAYAYLYLPQTLLKETKDKTGVARFLSSAGWILKLSYEFVVYAGVSHLPADQISLLETGDIILLDESSITLDNGFPRGRVEIRSRLLNAGLIAGDLICTSEGSATITVNRLFQEGIKSMTDADKKIEESSQANADVLSSIEIPVIVELARLRFTLEELSSMQQGQVIELKKGQPDTVDLTVDGKVIASGRLVDVEGKLGVQLTKVLHR